MTHSNKKAREKRLERIRLSSIQSIIAILGQVVPAKVEQERVGEQALFVANLERLRLERQEREVAQARIAAEAEARRARQPELARRLDKITRVGQISCRLELDRILDD